jgi:ABC-type glutathione transport system ATPase component
MKVEVKYKSVDYGSYRFRRVQSLFNAECNAVERTFNLPIEDMEWGLGLIVGSSGSGKTSIGRQIFGDNRIIDLYGQWPKDRPIIDAINPAGEFNEVTAYLAGVGLGDVPSWLKPFHHLSNGQQFRAGLARVLSSDEPEVVIDEFTSVVDRQIAKVGALAFGKAWRKQSGRRAVILSCHYDIIEWLQPDWVFNVDTGELKKKAKSDRDLLSKLTFSRSTEVTGSFLKSITI